MKADSEVYQTPYTPWRPLVDDLREGEFVLACVESFAHDAVEIAARGSDCDDPMAIAHLIAAAPEMYAALKEVERFCPCGARPESPTTHPHVTGCLISAALVKASGGAS